MVVIESPIYLHYASQLLEFADHRNRDSTLFLITCVIFLTLVMKSIVNRIVEYQAYKLMSYNTKDVNCSFRQ